MIQDVVDYKILAMFAAHAPTEVPDWYEAPLHAVRPVAPDVIGSLLAPTERIEKLVRDWVNDPCWDLVDSMQVDSDTNGEDVYSLNEYSYAHEVESKYTEYWEKRAEWRKKQVSFAYFSWRWYYAKCMFEHQPHE